MRKAQKEQVVGELQVVLETARHVIMSGYRGLTVKEVTELRRSVREAGGQMRVVKKTLFRRALEGRQEAGLTEYMEGPISVIFVTGDPLVVLKAMSTFARTHEALQFMGGWVENQLLDGQQLVELASLPPRDEMVARLLAALSGPLSQLVGVLQAVPRDLVLTLRALTQQRGGEAPVGA